MTNTLYIAETPDEVKHATGLHLLTANSPNGQTVQIMLEELADAYGTEWTTTVVDLQANEQKEEWYLRINPNGRIPALVDNSQNPPFAIHESSAELLYLLKLADTEDRFGFTDDLERNQALQWMLFWHGSATPDLGQYVYFTLVAPEKHPYVIERFRHETFRIFDVIEGHLSGRYTGERRDYLAGRGKGAYSVADIRTWTSLKAWEFAGLTKEEMEPFPHILKYIDRIAVRPAVQRGIGDRYNLRK